MDRYVLTETQWSRMEPHCLGRRGRPGRRGNDNRRFVEAVLWIARSHRPWRSLPARFGNWSTAFRRFRDWREADAFVPLFAACSGDPGMEYAMIEGRIVWIAGHGEGMGLRARPSTVASDPPAAARQTLA